MKNQIEVVVEKFNSVILTSGATREQITDLESAVMSLPNQLDGDAMTSHHFAPDTYTRQIDMPAGAVITGAIHKYAHTNIITKGVVCVKTEFGTATYTAPVVFVSEAGVKRALYIIEDTQWLTVHPNPDNTQDVKLLESRLTVDSFTDLDRFLITQIED